MTRPLADKGLAVLGIESSCDETAAAVVAGTAVRSSVVATQHDLHAEYGGVVPEIASRAHVERMSPVIGRALAEAGTDWQDLDAIAVGHRPGLIGSLLIGVAAARGIAWARGLPLIGVDHVHAHLSAGLLGRETGTLETPSLGLVVSGGHSSIYLIEDPLSPERLGGTIDDAVGEAFDKAAAILGLPHPGGPAIDALASREGADDRALDLPVSRLGRESLDFSFSGLKTALLYAVRGKPRPRAEGGGFERDHTSLSDQQRRDAAASFQRAASQAVTLKLRRSIEHVRSRGLRPRTLVAGGGVTANSRLRRELSELCQAESLTLMIPEPRYCVDNAAMIALLGSLRLAAGHRDELDLAPVPTTAC
ncbi:MAG: tRNA (adenosine(37)-N6)-threonylcarbamoyltransferase complex transferase subunit TsaD [Planctomycetota bacterium]